MLTNFSLDSDNSAIGHLEKIGIQIGAFILFRLTVFPKKCLRDKEIETLNNRVSMISDPKALAKITMANYLATL